MKAVRVALPGFFTMPLARASHIMYNPPKNTPPGMERAPNSVLDSGFKRDFVASPRVANRVMTRKSLRERRLFCPALLAPAGQGHMVFPLHLLMNGLRVTFYISISSLSSLILDAERP
jgi:hypothetical protein